MKNHRGRCIICNSPLKSVNREYCIKCYDKIHYQMNKQRYKEYAKKWDKDNPLKSKEIGKRAFNKFLLNKRKRFNELMVKCYQRSKKKWKSRAETKRILDCKRKKVLLKYVCKICKSTKDLQIHHEVYPIHSLEIRKAIKEGKVYFLCKKHHYECK